MSEFGRRPTLGMHRTARPAKVSGTEPHAAAPPSAKRVSANPIWLRLLVLPALPCFLFNEQIANAIGVSPPSVTIATAIYLLGLVAVMAWYKYPANRNASVISRTIGFYILAGAATMIVPVVCILVGSMFISVRSPAAGLVAIGAALATFAVIFKLGRWWDCNKPYAPAEILEDVS